MVKNSVFQLQPHVDFNSSVASKAVEAFYLFRFKNGYVFETNRWLILGREGNNKIQIISWQMRIFLWQ